MSKLTIPIPDLRFENTFRRSLRSYASTTKNLKQLLLANQDASYPEPIAVITPGTVMYAIIKDQILMQFLQGFGTAVFLMLLTPYCRYLLRSGQSWGVYVKEKMVDLVGVYSTKRGVFKRV